MRPKLTHLAHGVSMGRELYELSQTYIPMRGLVLVLVFMPYAIAWPIASRHRKAAPFRTLASRPLAYYHHDQHRHATYLAHR